MIFLRKFLRHGTRVASVAPSSRSMAREMCRHVDASRAQIIVELGAGTGAITRQIALQKHPASRVIAIEMDHDFIRRLEKAVPAGQVEICPGDVRNVSEILAGKGISHVDVVICGLALPSLPASVTEAVYDLMRTRAAAAPYSQLTEIPIPMYRKFYSRMFKQVEYKRVPVNIPPGGVYHCHTPLGG